jgi:PIN domain nuclease of toxin-antitoxin system
MVLLEFDYLFRRKKIRVGAKVLYSALNETFGIGLCTLPFATIAHEAVDLEWTMDPFDRLIVAQASANRGARLITRDRLIRKHYHNAVW